MRSRKSKRLFTFLLSLALAVSTFCGSGLSGAWSAKEANAKGAEDYGVANPRLAYCSTNESCRAVTYDIIEFGSYPQSEVTGEELTAAIKNAAYDKNGDAEVNGVKYRRVTKEDATHVAENRSYYDWNSGGDSGYHYFKYEPIRWRVLSVDGEKALLLSEMALDDKKYNDTCDREKSYTWEGCTLRSWLNGYSSAANGDGTDFTEKNFIGNAFTKAEQEAIVTTAITNADHPYYGTEGGNDTKDKVFLLSLSDTENADYGFVINMDISDEARRVKASTYAWAMGTWCDPGYYGEVNNHAGDWWLRSPGDVSSRAAYTEYVGGIGKLGFGGDYVDNDSIGCRPALYLNLSSGDTWKKAGISSTGEGEKLPEIPKESFAGISNPRVEGADRENCSFLNITYDVIEFGSYPQSEITGAAITADIKNASYDKNGDAEVNGQKYRRVTKEDANMETDSVGSNYYVYYDWNSGGDENGYHYFKYEPIHWRVLSVDGEKALLLSETVLDDKKYNDTHDLEKSYTWEGCTLRSWLNGYSSAANGDGTDYMKKNFIGSAFTKAEEAAIATTTLTNVVPWHPGNDTEDKVFLLTYSDMEKTDYGFENNNSVYYHYDEARRVKPSAYAWAMGTENYNGVYYAGNCSWWLRLTGYNGPSWDDPAYVNHDGSVSSHGRDVDYKHNGCRPALYLDLSSVGTWKKAGTYSTGKNAEQPDEPTLGPDEPATDPDNPTSSVANPRMAYCSENMSCRAVTYDIIEFGSYPQSVVTGAELTAAIKNAAYDKNGDAEVNGQKYRRVTKEDATYVADSESDDYVDYYDYYDWNSGGDENGYHYFKYEPIRWRVLSVDGEKALLLSETALDDKQYNNTCDEEKSCTWEDCTLRSWLNGYESAENGDGTDYAEKNFIESAFTQAEREAIATAVLVNADDSDYEAEGGNDTSDKIFLLSLTDIENADYGFVKNPDTYDEARRIKVSTYAWAMGAYAGSDVYTENCRWWLRSLRYAGGAANVNGNGDVDCTYVGSLDFSCCPALYLNLSSSDVWKKAGTYSTGKGEELPEIPEGNFAGVSSPRVEGAEKENCSFTNITYDVIEFGSYPQSEVTRAELTTAIKNAAYDKNGDAEVNGHKYRRVTKEDATYVDDFGWGYYYDWNSGGDENGYHYFKYESIRWRVLSVDEEKALLLSETALDDRQYNNTCDEEKSYTWEGCTMRSWLNGYGSVENGDGMDYTEKNFIGSAFTEKEQEAIVTATLVNQGMWGTEGGNNTSDKVFLLSLSDIRNANYGFAKDLDACDEAHRAKYSTYAQAMGASYTYGGSEYAGNCNWWLRSPGYNSSLAAYVNDGGRVDYYSCGVDGGNNGCRPALYLNLSSSNVWKKAGTYSTGKNAEQPDDPAPGPDNPTPGPDGPVVEFKRGDVDHDGNLTPDDALQILMKLAGKTSPKYHEDTAECDEKAGISPDDALQILMKLAGKPSKIDKYWTENK